MNSFENFFPVTTDEPQNWYVTPSVSDDFEVFNTIVCDSGPDFTEDMNSFQKNRMKLSFLNHSKRGIVNVESSVLKKYIFKLISQNLISSAEVAKACMDFILDEKYLNKMILEINAKGEVIKYYTDLAGCNDINIIGQSISEILKGLSNEFVEGMRGKFMYSNIEMSTKNIGNVEIQIHALDTTYNSFILLRY